MAEEAARAGFYAPPAHPKVPRVQILAVADLFAGKRPNIPMVASAFRRAAREATPQGGLDL